ncbi:hypothetical protein [Enterococcus sp. AZ109]|uniref:hypothetical protein n=1 Tax=Enterococcus sp. AZ109 TaxID=2774634 RepID=UPI003F276583
MKKIIMLISALALLSIFTGCRRENDSTNSTHSTTESSTLESTQATSSSTQEVETSESLPTVSDASSQQPEAPVVEQPNNSEPSGNQPVPDLTVAPSPEMALQILQNRDQNPDFGYTDSGQGTDDYGAYRKVKVASLSTMKQGGTGTLGFVKVYSDGTVVDTLDAGFEG